MPFVFPRVARPEVSVLMVTYGGGPFLERALAALLANTEPVYELIVVDNASPDGLAAALEGNLRNVTLVANRENFGFGTANDQAADRACGRALVLLNSDAFVEPGWLGPLLEAASLPGVGAAAPRVLNADGTLQEAGCLLYAGAETEFYGFGEDPDAEPYAVPRDVDYASGACLLVRRRAFTALGGFDPLFSPAYYEDVDLCLRLREHGWRVVYEPRSRVTHARGSSTPGALSQASAARNAALFRERWGALLAHRPAFAPPWVPGVVRRRVTSRDALADTRVLVACEELPAEGSAAASLVAALVSRRPACAATLFCSGGALAGTAARFGVETVAPANPAAWLEERRGHYDVVVSTGSLPPELEQGLAASQPQAVRLDELPTGVDPDGLDEALARLGVAPPTGRP